MAEARGWQLDNLSAATGDDELHGGPEAPDWERKRDRILSALAAIPKEARADYGCLVCSRVRA
jgi:hypothetical protein